MSDSKQSQDKWRAEQLREQRKARMASMKSKTGGKKPIKTGNKLATLIVIAVLVVCLALAGIWWAFSLGAPHRSVTALTIGDDQITAAEFNYYYYSQLSYYNIDPTSADGISTLRSDYDETFPTVADFLKDQAAKEIQRTAVLVQAARAAGVVLTDADQQTVESYMANIRNYALSNNQTLENFLISSYGKGMNETIMYGILEDYVLSDKYSVQLQDSYDIT